MNKFVFLVFIIGIFSSCSRDCFCEQYTRYSDGSTSITYIYAVGERDCNDKGGFFWCE